MSGDQEIMSSEPVESTAVHPDALAADSVASAVAVAEDESEQDFGYRVSLDAFAGPLDLLLYLVRRSEVDVTDISVAEIADQFLATLDAWEDLDLDVAGDFILMATTLLEIKSRLVAPPPETDDDGSVEEEEDFFDPRADLIRQLKAYVKVKEAVGVLSDLELKRTHWHNRRWQEDVPPDPEAEDQIELDNADAYQLFVAWDGVLKSIAGHRPRTVLYDDIPIEERVRAIEATMAEASEGQLGWLLEKVKTPIQRCGVVVAVLESVRKRIVEATQHEQYGSVYLRYRDEEDRTREPALPPEEDRSKKRRGRPPLVTYRIANASEASTEQQEVIAEIEEVLVESDEQRFTRELNEATGIDELLERSSDIDGELHRHLVGLGLIEDEDAIEEGLSEGQESTEQRPVALRESIEDHPEGESEGDTGESDDSEGDAAGDNQSEADEGSVSTSQPSH